MDIFKQKRRLGFSIGLYLLVVNGLAVFIKFIMNKTGAISNFDEVTYRFILNIVCGDIIGYAFLSVFLKKVDDIEKKEKQKLSIGRVAFFIVIAIGLGVVTAIATVMLVMPIQLLTGQKINNRLETLVENSNPFMLIGYVGIVGPIVEELIFRRLLLNKLRSYGDLTAIVYTGIIFGLCHTNLLQIPFAIVLGLVFGLIAVKTNNVKYSMIVHMAVNITTAMLNIFMQNGLYMYTAILVLGELLCALTAVIAVPIILSIEKYRPKVSNEGKYEKKKLYNNIGYIFTIIVVIILTVLAIIG